MRLKFTFLFVVLSSFCISCSLQPRHMLFGIRGKADTLTRQSVPYVYRIKPADELQLRNVQDPNAFSNQGTATAQAAGIQTFKVEEDGMVGLPVVGRIRLAGLTSYEAEKKIERLFRDSSLNNPIFELKILNLKVTMLGEVRSQGNYPLTKDGTTLVDVIGQAGGLTANADEKRVTIIRRNDQRVLSVDLSELKTIYDPSIVLQDGDIITVAQNKRAVRDENIQNISTVVQPTLLLMNTALIILSLLRLK